MQAEVRPERVNLLVKLEKDIPELTANWFSYYTLHWIGKFLNLGSKIKESDLPDVIPEREASDLTDKLEDIWLQESKKSKPSLIGTIWKTDRNSILACIFYGLLNGTFNFFSMSCIGLLIDWFGNHEVMGWYNNEYDALLILLGVIIANYLNAYFGFWSQYKAFMLGYTVRTRIAGVMYRKLFRLSAAGDRSAPSGKVLNLLNNDLRRIDDVFLLASMSVQFPIFLGGTIYQIAVRFGFYPFLAVAGGIIIGLCILAFQAVYLGSLREIIAESTDKRCKAMEELLSAIKIVKMYCWESAFLQKIMKFRKDEISMIKKRCYYGFLTHRMINSFGMILTIACLLVAFSEMKLTEFQSGDIFVAQTFIHDLNWNFGVLFWTVFLARESKISMERIQELLLAHERTVKDQIGSSEIKPNQELKNEQTKNESHVLELKNITAAWPKTSEPVLKDLNLSVEKGALIGIIGQVGSGKSSFLSLLLNELEIMNLTSEVHKKTIPSIAYVPQEAWIFGGTIRENILIGRKFVKEKYEEVIEACSLVSDLKNFKNADLSLVGEKGLTLSGGQRARINLARALYTDAEIYLLDDPLAAVDTKVVNFLYENAISTFLKNKTVILVTHHINLLTNADAIICLADSKIIFNGKYDDLKKLKDSEDGSLFLRDLIKNEMKEENSKKAEDNVQEVMKASEFLAEDQTDFLLAEEKKTGTLGIQYYIDYFLLCGSKLKVFIYLLVVLSIIASTVLIDLQLAAVGNTGDEIVVSCNETFEQWCDDRVIENSEIMNGMYWYIILIAITTLLQSTSALTYVNITLGTSQNSHDISVASVIKTPMDFFYANPVGRILNRFTKDMDVVDDELLGVNDELICLMVEMLHIVIITFISNWFAIILIIPTFIYIIHLRQKYVRTSREVMRIEGTLRSPVNTCITDANTGRVTINAYGIEKYVIDQYNQSQNKNGTAWVLIKQLIMWLQLRLDWIICTFYAALALMLIFLSDNETFSELFNLTPALIGLTLSKAFLLLGEFQYCINVSCRVENLLTSFERILEYSQLPDETNKLNGRPECSTGRTSVLKEGAEIKPEVNNESRKFNRKEAKENLERIIDSKNMKYETFQTGNISFEDFTFAYANNIPILKNINLDFKSGEKIGIIGRTGAGKSSLISAMYQMRQPISGQIKFNENESHDMFTIRKNLSIIPQEPIIFFDNVRKNLDPFESYSDEYLWDVLKAVGLKTKMESTGQGLDYILDEGGSNLSVGEKQLLCLGRAILRKSKILLIDEATANVDLNTDAFIQKQITQLFKESTVLTIAHRLNTIVHSDRIVILEKGNVVEFDSPAVLINQKDSFFRSLVEASKNSAEIFSALKAPENEYKPTDNKLVIDEREEESDRQKEKRSGTAF